METRQYIDEMCTVVCRSLPGLSPQIKDRQVILRDPSTGYPGGSPARPGLKHTDAILVSPVNRHRRVTVSRDEYGGVHVTWQRMRDLAPVTTKETKERLEDVAARVVRFLRGDSSVMHI